MTTTHRPTSASVQPADRRKQSMAATIGGPCHAVTTAGHFCKRRSVVIADDGYGYCKPHAKGRE